MNIKYTKNNSLFSMEMDTLYITLGNGNEVMIYETESGVLHVENTTDLHLTPEPKLGLMIESQNYSTVHIIPEG